MRRFMIWELSVVVGIVATLLGLLAYPVHRAREAAARSSCNLAGVSHALLCYQEEHGRLPPAVLRDADGQPLLSWRVLILPYLEGQELYKEFRLHEPWDSPHNLALLPRMPSNYAGPAHKKSLLPAHHTVLRVFVGPGTPFEEGRSIPLTGEEETILFVEAGEPVPWTKPDYLPYDPEKPLPELRGLFRNGFRSCLVWGTYRFIDKDMPEAEFRSLIVRTPRQSKE